MGNEKADNRFPRRPAPCSGRPALVPAPGAAGDLGGGRAPGCGCFPRRPAHRRPGANFPRPALGAAGRLRGALGAPPGRARLDGEAGRARAAGDPRGGAGESPALVTWVPRVTGVRLRGRRDAAQAGRSPRPSSAAAAAPGHASAAPGRAVGEPNPWSPPQIPSHAGRGGETGGGAEGPGARRPRGLHPTTCHRRWNPVTSKGSPHHPLA